jgi:hypothetical protein
MGRALAITLILFLAAVIPVWAALEYVYVDLFFNIGAADELTVTLLGQSAVTSSPSGQATPANIEFNVTGNTSWENASVTGGSQQSNITPILSLDNTGTTDLEINISINASLPSGACTMDLRYINDSAPYDIDALNPEDNGSQVSTTNITIDSAFTPSEATWGIWLYGNFSGCIDSDDTVRRFFIWSSGSE